ncbi:hypothetical protein B0T09DRAFT_167495 [Sordaria sp. MPI-SDFR-AT-0083]|nr:hypothetical protein B0T09DRAFT_167495 [Sordaria sp. MPI-SDFR-AT-0083]
MHLLSLCMYIAKLTRCKVTVCKQTTRHPIRTAQTPSFFRVVSGLLFLRLLVSQCGRLPTPSNPALRNSHWCVAYPAPGTHTPFTLLVERVEVWRYHEKLAAASRSTRTFRLQ